MTAPPIRPKFDGLSDEPWARKLNGRWIVHGGLRDAAAAYLDHLAATDPDRLARSCRQARRLVRCPGPEEDPKPWFYGGLFSLANASEAETFLSAHPLLRAVVPVSGNIRQPDELAHASEMTRRMIRRLRHALAESVAEM